MNKRALLLTCLLGASVAVSACEDDDEGNGTIRIDARGGGTTTVDAGTVADAAAPPDAEVEVDAGPTAPSWTTVYTEVITPRCLPCHADATQIGITLGQLDMSSQATAFNNLVNKAATGPACSSAGIRVVPGSPDTSVLYLKVDPEEPTPCGAKMPFTGTISEEEVEMIEAWIEGGAPND
jgi:hypothetical protein